MSRRLLLELVGFQLVWWTAAICAARGTGAPGIAAAALFVALQLAFAERSTAIWPTAAVAGGIGIFVESLLSAYGLVRFAAPWPVADGAPAWLVALWTAFGTTVLTVRRALGSRPFVHAAALGVVLGPVSYLAGAGLGALELREPLITSLLAIAAVWGVALPVLLLVLELVEGRDSAGTV